MTDEQEDDDWLHEDDAQHHRSIRTEDAEMDITPMIDMTFLLLIFFLVCSTPDQHTMIDLPSGRYGAGVSERESLIITVSDEGVDTAPVYLADGKVESERLTDEPEEQGRLIAEAVEKSKQEDAKDNVIIKADRNVAHREVARVIKAVSRVEGAKIYLAVLEAE